MKRIFLSILLLLLLAFLVSTVVACDSSDYVPMIKAGDEYFYVVYDQDVKVKNDNFIRGYSLRSTKDERVIYTFQYYPKEIRLEDYNDDGIKDLIFIVPDPDVEDDNPIFIVGHSMQVALGNSDGTFQPAKVIATFKNLN